MIVHMYWTGERIKASREAHGLTQQQLAGAIGGSRRAVGAWEKGDSMPQGRFLAQLDRVLGSSIAEGPRAGEDVLLREATFEQVLHRLLTLYTERSAIEGATRYREALDRLGDS